MYKLRLGKLHFKDYDLKSGISIQILDLKTTERSILVYFHLSTFRVILKNPGDTE